MKRKESNNITENLLHIRYSADFLLFVLLTVFVSFFYFGITVHQQVSWDYNVPIAQNILSGEIFKRYGEGIYLYSPGSSHVFLSPFLLIGLPNLFGLLGFVFLFIVSKKLGNVFGLTNHMAVIFGASICTTISIIRTVSDQSIDKWLCAWFVLCVILLEKPQKTLKFALLLGLALGMLIGTKYSGPLFFLALLPIYAKTLIRFFSPMRFLITGAVVTLTGLFWYIRNFILEGNPYYPANLLFFKGYPNFTQQDWMLWKIPFEYPGGIMPLIHSFISEYMIWAFFGFVLVWYLVRVFHKRQKIDKRLRRVLFLLLTTGLVSLMLPITPMYWIELYHLISDMRYIHIFVLMGMLGVFLLADKYKMNSFLAIAAVLGSLTAFAFIPYQPKLFLLSIALFLFFFYKRPKIFQKVYEL